MHEIENTLKIAKQAIENRQYKYAYGLIDKAINQAKVLKKKELKQDLLGESIYNACYGPNRKMTNTGD